MSPLLAFFLLLSLDATPQGEVPMAKDAALPRLVTTALPLTLPPLALPERLPSLTLAVAPAAGGGDQVHLATPRADFAMDGQAATLWRADDGLFYVDATINGANVRLIVDTGASMTVLSPDDARRVGAAFSGAAFDQEAQTAAGASRMARVTLSYMRVGTTSASLVSAVVASQPLAYSLLGQNWLSRIGSVTIEGDRMTMR